MGLFGLDKKNKQNAVSCSGSGQEGKVSCTCGSGLSDAKKARLIVLGACCQASTDTAANVRQAAAELGLTDEVLVIGDAVEIAQYGVMQLPALVINSRVVSLGRLIRVEEAKKLIQEAGIA